MMTFFGLAHMVDATQLLGWGGVGWGRDDDILWTWTHGGCYAHMVDATQLLGWGRDDDILWTCTHGGCYATAGVGWGGVGMMTFFGLAHMVDATQLLGWGGVGMMTFFELAHMVDATQLLGWGGVGRGGLGMMTFFELAHMVDATQLLGWGGVGSGWWHSLNLNTWWMLRTHGGCYATAGVGWGGLGMMTFFELAQEARLANRRCRKRIEAWGSRRKDCMIWAVPRKKGSECGTGKGQGCSVVVSKADCTLGIFYWSWRIPCWLDIQPSSIKTPTHFSSFLEMDGLKNKNSLVSTHL